MTRQVIDMTSITGNNLRKHNTKLLEFIVLDNFIHLEKYPKLKHNKTEINRLFNDLNTFYISSSIDGRMIGYILGEYIKLSTLDPSDNRLVCYISYIYVVEEHRKNSVGSNMMKYLIDTNNDARVSGFMLTFDTKDNKLKSFYEKRGFMQDISFRTYTKFDVYFKSNNHPIH